MAIIGAHALLYSSQADELRDVLRDVFELEHVDAGRGWLIFKLPPAEVAVHPTDGAPAHELSLVCDDIETTMADLRAKGVEFQREPRDDGWGLTTVMVLPGGVEVMLYQARHATAF
jgi:hypothetical protein